MPQHNTSVNERRQRLVSLLDASVRQASDHVVELAVWNPLLSAQLGQALGGLLFVDVLLPRPPRNHLAFGCDLEPLCGSLQTPPPHINHQVPPSPIFDNNSS
jgi:hypothetical protein